jgi:hypothetical protein
MTAPRDSWPKTIKARTALDRALDRLARTDQRTPCQHPDTSQRWTSERDIERQLAAKACHGCPVLQLCSDAADARDEHWYVWGGRDRTRKPRASRKAA